MAFAGVAPSKTKAQIRSKSGMILLIDSVAFNAATAPTQPGGGAAGAYTIAGASIKYLGVVEHKTLKTPINPGEVVTDQYKTELGIEKLYEGEGTLLGTYENSDLNELENGLYAMLIADPASVTAMTGFSSSAADMSGITVGQVFNVHTIKDKLSINVNEANDFGEAQRTPITFKHIMDDIEDGYFKNVNVTISA